MTNELAEGSKLAEFKVEGVSTLVFRKILAGAAAGYSVNKRVPTVEEIHFYSGAAPKSISKVLATQEFKDIMERRGYAWDKAKLTPEQEFAVGIITDPSRRGDMASKLKAAGISFSQYRAWMKQPHFKDFISKVGEDMLGEHIQDVHTSVVNRATNGDINAAKLVYELTGRYDPAKQQVIDLQAIISLLLEVITRHVRDPIVLGDISRDVELVMDGKIPKALTSFDITENTIQDADIVFEGTASDMDSEVLLPAVENVEPVGKEDSPFNF
jgi:hypothetical protein